jgi:hypothetical protein
VSDMSPEARALLDAGRDATRPTAEDRERIAAALQVRLGDGYLPSDTRASHVGAPPPAATSTLSWPLISAIVAGLAVSGAAGVYALRSTSTEPLAAVAPPSAAPAPVKTTLAPPTARVEHETPIEPLPPVEAPAATPSSRRQADRLAEEVAILSRAETELHAGRYSEALRVLEEHQHKFPRGTLSQERTAARIRALCGLGRTSEANAALARLSPGSLHEGPAREACAITAKK